MNQLNLHIETNLMHRVAVEVSLVKKFASVGIEKLTLIKKIKRKTSGIAFLNFSDFFCGVKIQRHSSYNIRDDAIIQEKVILTV